MTNTHNYIYTRTTVPQGSITIFAYIPGAFWAIQHLTEPWHLQIIGHMIYMTLAEI